jgi:hypothetical protein
MTTINPNIQSVAIGFSSANSVSYQLVHQNEIKKGRSEFLLQYINDFSGIMSSINSVNHFLKNAKYTSKIDGLATITSQAILAGIYYMHVNKDSLNINPKIKKLTRFLQENISTVINAVSIAFAILSIPYASAYFGYTFTITTLALLNDYFNIVKIPYLANVLKSAELTGLASLLAATTKVNLFFSLPIVSFIFVNDFIFVKNKINNFFKSYTKTNFSFSQIHQFVKKNNLNEKFRLTGNDLLALKNASQKENPEYINIYFNSLKFSDDEIEKILKNLEDFDPILDGVKKDNKVTKSKKDEIIKELQKRLKNIIQSSNKHSISKDLISSIAYFLKDKNINSNLKKEAILYLAIEGKKCETAKIDAIKKAFFKLASNQHEASDLKIATLSSIQTLQESIISSLIYKFTKNKTKENTFGIDNKLYAANDRHYVSVLKAMWYPTMSGIEYDEAFLPIHRVVYSFIGNYLLKNNKTRPKYSVSTLIDFLEEEVKSNAIPVADLWQFMHNWMEKNIAKNDLNQRDKFMDIAESKEATRFALAILLRDLNIIE